MAVTGTLIGTLQVAAQGGLPSLNLAVNMSSAASPGLVTLLNLTTTPTSVPIPTGTRYITLEGPSGNTTNLAIGGTGVALANMQLLDPANQAHIPVIASSPVLLIACVSGTVSGVQVVFW